MSEINLSASQMILIAALEMHQRGVKEFSEWDLTVEAWKLDPKRFGCRGYTDLYPDHKRVMMEIMGKTKKDNPVTKGWIKKVRPNFYKLMPSGVIQAQSLRSDSYGQTRSNSNEQVYDALKPYLEHRVFTNFVKNGDKPNMWLTVEAFYGITALGKAQVEAKLRAFEQAIEIAKAQVATSGSFSRGPVGGSQRVTADKLGKLDELHELIKQGFAKQFETIRRGK
ncbi:MAG TPA: hypothetical protein VG944_06055 [Fimbriimonas sp.]|nr:hypothetical protein [Fimbriimonas sp.]